MSAHVVGQEKPISTDLFGIFIEDLNYTADGGLYAEMVQNRSFEYSPHDIDLHMYYKKGQWHPFTAWESLKDGNAISRISLETERPLNSNNRHYVTMTVFTAGSKGAGLGNTVQNAIAEAAYMCNLERNGDVVWMSSYAPLLARIGNTQWNPDLIYFDKTDVYPTVNYYVQQLFGQNHGDTYLFNVVSGTETASCVRDSKTGTVTVKLANPTDSIVSINVNLSGVKLKGRTATITTLQGERDYKNGQGVHLDTDVKPTVSQERLPKCFKRELPPYSFTVITY